MRRLAHELQLDWVVGVRLRMKVRGPHLAPPAYAPSALCAGFAAGSAERGDGRGLSRRSAGGSLGLSPCALGREHMFPRIGGFMPLWTRVGGGFGTLAGTRGAQGGVYNMYIYVRM